MICTEEIAHRITVSRKQRGLTQNELSELMGVTPQAVSKWETGRAIPDLSRLDELAAVLDVEVTYLLWGSPPIPSSTAD